jgi:crotonobetainyl-CoA:carnitine CoA-transferase CaiB-like acyl-CoA transferase
MQKPFDQDIEMALGADTQISVTQINDTELPSCFAVTDLAVATIRAAAVELAALCEEQEVTIDRHLAALWFDMTLRPQGWELPSAWDVIAGVYRTSDGWIRLHTNAPHHRDAALRVLKCSPDKKAVASAVAEFSKTKLEDAIVAENGAAATMHSLQEWAMHPQGQAVSREPLIAWQENAKGGKPVKIEQLKVLDLTRVLAGPVATRFLAGFGAQVLRIDPPWWAEPGVEPEVTLGKRRSGLDLTQAGDRKVFEHLLGQADVLVHGYRPGALSGLGYGPDHLRSLAPHLIDVSLCAYGWSGPWADRRGFDSLVQMSCGIASEGMQRAGKDHPVPLPVQALDHATGYLMAAAVLRAVRVRNQTGRIMSARLSLARTAALLVTEGAHNFCGNEPNETSQDVAPSIEMTSWGPAQRLKFPVQLNGTGPSWRYPAGHLRIDPPSW